MKQTDPQSAPTTASRRVPKEITSHIFELRGFDREGKIFLTITCGKKSLRTEAKPAAALVNEGFKEVVCLSLTSLTSSNEEVVFKLRRKTALADIVLGTYAVPVGHLPALRPSKRWAELKNDEGKTVAEFSHTSWVSDCAWVTENTNHRPRKFSEPATLNPVQSPVPMRKASEPILQSTKTCPSTDSVESLNSPKRSGSLVSKESIRRVFSRSNRNSRGSIISMTQSSESLSSTGPEGVFRLSQSLEVLDSEDSAGEAKWTSHNNLSSPQLFRKKSIGPTEVAAKIKAVCRSKTQPNSLTGYKIRRKLKLKGSAIDDDSGDDTCNESDNGESDSSSQVDFISRDSDGFFRVESPAMKRFNAMEQDHHDAKKELDAMLKEVEDWRISRGKVHKGESMQLIEDVTVTTAPHIEQRAAKADNDNISVSRTNPSSPAQTPVAARKALHSAHSSPLSTRKHLPTTNMKTTPAETTTNNSAANSPLTPRRARPNQLQAINSAPARSVLPNSPKPVRESPKKLNRLQSDIENTNTLSSASDSTVFGLKGNSSPNVYPKEGRSLSVDCIHTRGNGPAAVDEHELQIREKEMRLEQELKEACGGSLTPQTRKFIRQVQAIHRYSNIATVNAFVVESEMIKELDNVQQQFTKQIKAQTRLCVFLSEVRHVLIDHGISDDIVTVELELHRLALAASNEPKRAEYRASCLVPSNVAMESRAFEELAWEEAAVGMTLDEKMEFILKMEKMRDLHKQQSIEMQLKNLETLLADLETTNVELRVVVDRVGGYLTDNGMQDLFLAALSSMEHRIQTGDLPEPAPFDSGYAPVFDVRDSTTHAPMDAERSLFTPFSSIFASFRQRMTTAAGGQ